MSKNTNTAVANAFQADIDLALATLNTLNLKGERPTAARAFLEATSDDEREAACEEFGYGFIRRGLRQLAIRAEKDGNQNAADAFWALRDDIDPDGVEVFRIAA